MLLVSDVHGAFESLRAVVARNETLLILGDLINLLDYRTQEGIIADVLGTEFGAVIAKNRALGDYDAMRQTWGEATGERRTEITKQIQAGIKAQYELCQEALAGADSAPMATSTIPSSWPRPCRRPCVLSTPRSTRSKE